MRQCRTRQLQSGLLQTGYPSSDRTATHQTSQSRPAGIRLGIQTQQAKPQTEHSSLNEQPRTRHPSSDQTVSGKSIQLKLKAVAPDVQVQSEHCLGLHFLRPIIQARTKQPQPRPDSIKQDIQAQVGHPSRDQTYYHIRSDQLRQSGKSEVRLASHSPSADIQVHTGQSNSGHIILQTRRHRTNQVRPDIQTQAGHPKSG